MEEAKKLELAIELAKLEVLGQIRDDLRQLAKVTGQVNGRSVSFPIQPTPTDERVKNAFNRLESLLISEEIHQREE